MKIDKYFFGVDSTHTIHLPDHSPQQSRASLIVEGDDHAGGW